MKEFSYVITPFLAWLIAGILKFLINSLKARRFAFDLIGYGGLPSNHSAIVSSMATLIALKEGINIPVFGVAIALAFIVILDASSLRKQVGKHAEIINQLNSLTKNSPSILRERMGHTRVEILAGVITGSAVAYSIFCFS
ncbi:divergent PAP2 family protein [Polynucleobacter sp. UK-Mo-2m-Kol15]|uniref:divergent PAP2 family protein n=1 Tax=Polynucleobacter sp. UK-Mo-2m-Kol15 TaxID=2576916 RepID=UPI001C0BAD3F|nr:divergent PAP2 family protein [Polynucleobacter sp. UK-Mo-2m-Kol15]MBU3574792.1 divergent PAP2 family protein [Polynucleobacter sp. UK-Mo-2m-Kol15]